MKTFTRSIGLSFKLSYFPKTTKRCLFAFMKFVTGNVVSFQLRKKILIIRKYLKKKNNLRKHYQRQRMLA